MAKIITKHSTTPGSAPSGLTIGELAVNLADRDLYVGGTAGTTYLTGVKSFNGQTGAVQGVSSFLGSTGAIGFDGGQGITLTVSGATIGVSLNYLYGSTAINSTKYQEKGDWIVVQDSVAPNSMKRTQIANVSYLLLGSEGTKGSGNFFRMATNINAGAGTVDDEYVPFNKILDEIVGIVDGGTFA